MSINDRQNKVRAGSKGGKSGGPARAKALTPAQRANIAKQGGQAKAKKNPKLK